MSLILTGIGLLASGIGAGIKAYKNNQAKKEAASALAMQRESILSDMYSNPLDSVSNVALLSRMDRKIRRNNEAVENMAAAGGATFENTLAAKQASNEAIADVYSGVLEGDQARKDAYKQQLLNIDSQRVAQRVAALQNAGEGWAQFGNNMSGAFTTLGGSMLESGKGFKDLLKF